MEGKVLGVPLPLIILVLVILLPLIMFGYFNYLSNKALMSKLDKIESVLICEKEEVVGEIVEPAMSVEVEKPEVEVEKEVTKIVKEIETATSSAKND
jgi:endonuclease V-like protein UPF0215 family